ncbi:MAG: ABC transporter substrate-binding protein [candidate division Zixibacteria bacterium]|nr:ABC transporter substrate-binding protein [candidate division Zixibacteria bacterium]
MKRTFITSTALAMVFIFAMVAFGEGIVKVGLNYPKTGPYEVQGLDQWRAAQMAVEEINAAGGVLGKQVEIVWRDSQSKKDVTVANVTDLIDNEGVQMVFGGSSSGVAIAAGGVCQAKGIPFFGTLTYSNATTGKAGYRHTFRECFNAWMGAKAISMYLKMNFPKKNYYYITADYTWGWSTEESLRKFTGTDSKTTHKGTLTPFPGATNTDFQAALKLAQEANPDVLVLVLFGNDMANAAKLAHQMGMKNTMQIVVPNLTLGMAESGGPEVMEGVVGALPWCWNVPYKYDYPRGKEYVKKFSAKYGRYPSTSGASAYTIMHEWKAAVERANSFKAQLVIPALEGHSYTWLKGEQTWRDFDHQSIQSVYAVKCKPAAEVAKDKYGLDYFEIISSTLGSRAVRNKAEWQAARQAAGKPSHLEPLAGEPAR